MNSSSSAELRAGLGLVGNANQGGKRQVTIIEQEVWAELMRELNSSLPPSVRRANLMIEGIRLINSRGKILRIGTCRIRVCGETEPCERMDEALPGLKDAMFRDWHGGAYGTVLDDGQVSVGNEVSWEE
jgi:MOSC domain-containing protein YiiM